MPAQAVAALFHADSGFGVREPLVIDPVPRVATLGMGPTPAKTVKSQLA